MNINRIDLNLLLAFEALFAERSVSRAATRLSIGQPAASNALARLRVLFDDDLFRRDGRMMMPTPRALALAEPIGRALAAAREALEPAIFDPARAVRAFTVSGGDYALTTILPALMSRVRREAPGVDLRFRFIEKDRVLDLLDEGTLDMALGVLPSVPKRFEVSTLFEERFVCLMRRDHPALADGLTAESYTAAPHLLVTERGDERGAVDQALASLGLSRRIALTVPSVLVVRRVLLRSDLIATIGARAAHAFSSDEDLVTCAPPIMMPPWRMSLIALQRAGRDPALAWLKKMIAAAVDG